MINTKPAYESVCQTTSIIEDPTSQGQAGVGLDSKMLRNYFLYDSNGVQVYTWPVWAIVIAILTCIGLLITIIAFITLLILYPVRSGTSILGFMAIIGIMGIYAINFAFFVQASNGSCGARRFVMGVVYSIVFAALLVKVVDNWRFADWEYGEKKYRYAFFSMLIETLNISHYIIKLIVVVIVFMLLHFPM